MVDYSKWDKLANDLGDDFELEDEDSKREWMSRWEMLQKEQEDQFYGSETDKGKSGNLRRQLGLAEEQEEEAGVEVVGQEAPRVSSEEDAESKRSQTAVRSGRGTGAGSGGDGGGGLDMKELLHLPIMQQAMRGEIVDPEQEYLEMLAKEAKGAADASPVIHSHSSSQSSQPPSASSNPSQHPASSSSSPSDQADAVKEKQAATTATATATASASTTTQQDSTRPALPSSGWARLGLPALGDQTGEAREKRLGQLRLWAEVASVEPEEGGDALRSLQQRAAVLQLVKLVFDPTFAAAMVELLLCEEEGVGDAETVSATADLLSRLYVPFLSPAALPPTASCPPLSSLFLLFAKGGILSASVRLLLLSPSLPPTTTLSLLCIFQSVLVFHPEAVGSVTSTTGLSTDFASAMLEAMLVAATRGPSPRADAAGGGEEEVLGLVEETAVQCVAQVGCLRLVEGVEACFQPAVEAQAAALLHMARARLGWSKEEEEEEEDAEEEEEAKEEEAGGGRMEFGREMMEGCGYVVSSLCRHRDMFGGREQEEWCGEETARVLRVVAEQDVVGSICACMRALLAALEGGERQAEEKGAGRERQAMRAMRRILSGREEEGEGEEEAEAEEVVGAVQQWQGGMLGLCDALLSLLLLTTPSSSPSSTASNAAGEGEEEGKMMEGGEEEQEEGGFARGLEEEGVAELLVRALAASKALEQAGGGQGVVWWVKGLTTVTSGGEELRIGQCTCTPYETCIAALLVLDGAAGGALSRLPQAARQTLIAAISGGGEAQEAGGLRRVVEEEGERLAEGVKQRGNSKMNAAWEYSAALYYYSMAMVLAEGGRKGGREEAMAVLLGNRSEVLNRLKRGRDAERDALAALGLGGGKDGGAKNQRRLQRALELQGKALGAEGGA